MHANSGKTPTQRGYGPIFFLAGLFFLNFISRLVLAPLLPAMERDLGMSHAQAGGLFLFISLGYCLTMLGSGYLAARLDHRRSIMISVLGVGLAMIATGTAGSLWTIRGCLLLLGAAAGLYFPSGIATLISLAPTGRLGMAMAVHELAPNLGFVAAPVLAQVIMEFLAWRWVLLILGALCLMAAALYHRLGRGGRFKGTAPNLAALKGELGSIKLWRLILVLCLGLGASVGVYAMLPLYLVSEHSFTTAQANFLVAASRVSGVGMALAAGWASDRFGPRRAAIITLALAGFSTLMLGLTSGWPLMAMAFLQPAVLVCLFPPIFTALAQMEPQSASNLRVALAVATGIMVGSGIIPGIMGWAGEVSSFAHGFVGLGLAMCAGAFLPPDGLGAANRAANRRG